MSAEDTTPAASLACSRCGEVVSTRTPFDGHTQRIGLSKTTVKWRLRFSRFRWTWLPEDPHDRVKGFYTDLDLCDWCAGDVFLFAQGLPPRVKPAKASQSGSPEGRPNADTEARQSEDFLTAEVTLSPADVAEMAPDSGEQRADPGPHEVRQALIAYSAALRSALRVGVRIDSLLAAGIPIADIRTAQQAGEQRA